MPIRVRPSFALVLALAAGAALAGTARSQPGGGAPTGASPAETADEASPAIGERGSRLLRDLRQRLLGHSGPDALREASLLPDAAAAREVMEGLAGRGGDEVTAARAALWLGHYHYSAGDAEAALSWFQKARDAGGGPSERAETDFWVAQCRNLLGRPQDGRPDGSGEGVETVLGQMARLDGELRVGRVESSLRGYARLEEDARRAGCLGPLLYRFGLAAASGAGGAELGWPTVREWASACATSPEYALVQAMQPPPSPPAAAPEAGGRSEAAGTSFVEMPSARPAAGDAGSDSSAAAGGRSPEVTLSPSEETRPDAKRPAAAAGGDRRFAIQLGSFRDAERAAAEAQRLEGLGLSVRVEVEEAEGATFHRIRFGRFSSREEAEESALARCVGLNWQVVRVGP